MVIQSYLGYRQKTTALKQNSNQLKQKGINLTSKSGNSGMAGSRDLNDTISSSYWHLIILISSFCATRQKEESH